MKWLESATYYAAYIVLQYIKLYFACIVAVLNFAESYSALLLSTVWIQDL